MVHINQTGPCSSRCCRIHIDMSSRLGDQANQHPQDRLPSSVSSCTRSTTPPSETTFPLTHNELGPLARWPKSRQSSSPALPSHPSPPSLCTECNGYTNQCFDRHARVDNRAQMEPTAKFDGVVACYFGHVMESLRLMPQAAILGAATAITVPVPSPIRGLACWRRSRIHDTLFANCQPINISILFNREPRWTYGE